MFLFKNVGFSQINLIQNSGFEKYSNLNCNNVAIDDYSIFPSKHVLDNWYTLNSSDYFTAVCTPTNTYRGVPINDFGNETAKNGVAYCGVELYYDHPSIEVKEYLYQQLNSSLKQDSVYCLSFFVSLADRATISIKEMGAYFSVNIPSLVTNYYINATPQVVNTSSYIIDTLNWVEIRGCFTAQGGEQYITIGNFNSNINTDTATAYSTNPLTGAGNHISYYYIDSVTLWQNNFPTFIKEDLNTEIVSVYPNPAKDILNFNVASVTERKKLKVEVTDVIGREILVSEYKEQLNISQLEKGIYFFRIYEGNKIIVIKKNYKRINLDYEKIFIVYSIYLRELFCIFANIY